MLNRCTFIYRCITVYYRLIVECKDGTMCRVLNILLGLLSRILYALHGFIMVWCVRSVKSGNTYWLLLTGVLLLSVEMAITIKCTRNATWKRWLFNSIFVFILSRMLDCWVYWSNSTINYNYNSQSVYTALHIR